METTLKAPYSRQVPYVVVHARGMSCGRILFIIIIVSIVPVYKNKMAINRALYPLSKSHLNHGGWWGGGGRGLLAEFLATPDHGQTKVKHTHTEKNNIGPIYGPH